MVRRSNAFVLGVLTAFAWEGGFAGPFQVAQSQSTSMQRAQEAAAAFLSELKVEAGLSEDSTFVSGETVGVGDLFCSRFRQLLNGREILGAQAQICFSPTGEAIERAARLCDGECLKAREDVVLNDAEMRGRAVEAMRQALKTDPPRDTGWSGISATGVGTVFDGPVAAAAEPAWIQSEDLSAVRGGYVVHFQGPAHHFVAYMDGRGALVTYENRIWFASARGQVYPRDPVTTPDLKKVRLENLLSADRLASPYWSIQNEDVASASSAEGDYLYGLESTHFDEVQAYYGMQVGMPWLISRGYQPFRSLPIVVHYGENYGNAYYDGDQIVLGDGDGKELKDLARDGTVLIHENGHRAIDELAQIVMSGNVGDGPAVHEGMADFIACATYNDPTVGTGIMMSEKPMRRCDTDILLTSSSRKGEAHEAGQIWSGALWEVRESPDVGADAADQISIDALIRLKPTGLLGATKMEDMYRAVMASDKALFQGSHQSAMKAIFARRGFVKKSGAPAPTNWLWPKALDLIASNQR
ncbi:MAG: hypothetical protein V1798_07010 [Pseudomonadota bacterium]